MLVSNSKDIKKLGTILTVWAHPDDETWSAAGILFTARQNGQKVCCVTATRGEAGVQDELRWPAHKLANIREKEMQAALEILDIREHHWLNYEDGKCDSVPVSDAVAKLSKIIASVQPDTVLTFGPTGTTGHPDHIAVGRWIEAALDKAHLSKATRLYHTVVSKQAHDKAGKRMDRQFNIFFNIDEPPIVDEREMDICIKLTGDARAAKLAAMRAQPSQTDSLFIHANPDDLDTILCCEGFSLAKTYN